MLKNLILPADRAIRRRKGCIKMKIKDGYLLREVAGNIIVVPVGEAAMNFNGLISLNETGAFLWKLLENDVEPKFLLSELMKEYDVDEEQAKKDITDVLNKLYSAGVLDAKQKN